MLIYVRVVCFEGKDGSVWVGVCVSTHQDRVLAGQSRQYCEVTCVPQLGPIFCVGSVHLAGALFF